MSAYGKAKAKIFANQTENEYLVINKDDADCYRLAAECKAKVVPFSTKEELNAGVFVENEKVVIADFDGSRTTVCALNDIRIIGEHNISNVVAAAGICYFAGIDAEIIATGIRAFNGVEHRIEYCGEYDGVRYRLAAGANLLFTDPRRMGKTFWMRAFAARESDFRCYVIDYERNLQSHCTQ